MVRRSFSGQKRHANSKSMTSDGGIQGSEQQKFVWRWVHYTMQCAYSRKIYMGQNSPEKAL